MVEQLTPPEENLTRHGLQSPRLERRPLGDLSALGLHPPLLPLQFDDLHDLGRRPSTVLLHQPRVVVLVEVDVLVVATGPRSRPHHH